MSKTNFAAIILAAGKGTRMKSTKHKVLHPVGGRPMLAYLLETVTALEPAKTVLVVGSGKEQLQAAVTGAHFVEQTEQLGTGHAAKVAVQSLAGFNGDIIVLFGDVPFISSDIMGAMITRGHEVGISQASSEHHAENGMVVLGFRPNDPAKYGRLIVDTDGHLERIVEYKDASEEERAITLCNSGMMWIKGSHASKWLDEIKNDNAAGEFYLTDLVALARRDGFSVATVEAPEEDVLGVNNREDLARAEAARQRIWRKTALEAGVTMTDPETVYFSYDTKIGCDVTIEPGVFFGRGVVVEDGVTIKAYSHIEGATIRRGAIIGPFARLRPAADIGENAKVGNFVEVKKAKVAEGAKINHLSYIGDAEIGAAANIGAGTITCNYDGFLKYPTKIGAGAFIGSNSALVAPVTIGNGAIVGAGSIITKDVGDDALAVARGKQREIKGYAAKFREEKTAEKSNLKNKTGSGA